MLRWLPIAAASVRPSTAQAHDTIQVVGEPIVLKRLRHFEVGIAQLVFLPDRPQPGAFDGQVAGLEEQRMDADTVRPRHWSESSGSAAAGLTSAGDVVAKHVEMQYATPNLYEN